MKILIIDDDRLLRNELAGQLRKNGYEVVALEMFDSTEQVIKENGFHFNPFGRYIAWP